MAKYRKPLNDWFKKCFIQWISDINIAIHYLFRIVYENYSLYDIVLENVLARLTSTFEGYNNCSLTEEFLNNEENFKDDLILKEKLYSWLTIEYHPKIIDEDVYKALLIFNHQNEVKKYKIFPKIQKWIEYSDKIKGKIYVGDWLVNANIQGQDEKDKCELIERYYHKIKLIKNLFVI